MKIFAAILSSFIACTMLGACSLASYGEPDALIVDDVDGKDASALIAAIKGLSTEGVAETHYDVTALEAAIATSEPALIRTRAKALFNSVATDLTDGLTAPEARLGWRMESLASDADALDALEEKAFNSGEFAEAFTALAPKHEQYRLLKAALGNDRLTADEEASLRLNMDRWRWMPKALGEDYILVNVPAFELTLVQDGKITSRHRVVTGTQRLPTPQFTALVTGVIFNPTWFVPPSIVRESVGALMKNDPARAKRLGYYLGADGGVQQKPGPANALGQVKLAMPNPYSIFLHDTPSKDVFDRDIRALSHGCIRVDGAVDFARELLGEQAEDNDVPGILASRRTTEIAFENPLPVYVVYFTAFATDDGTVAYYPDIYGRDAPLLAAFGGAAPEDADPIKTLIEESCPETSVEGAAPLPDNL